MFPLKLYSIVVIKLHALQFLSNYFLIKLFSPNIYFLLYMSKYKVQSKGNLFFIINHPFINLHVLFIILLINFHYSQTSGRVILVCKITNTIMQNLDETNSEFMCLRDF